MDRSTSGRTAAAVVLLTLGLAGCGGSERDQARERVDAYVKSEEEVMQRAQPEFQRANESYLAYSRGELAAGGRRARTPRRPSAAIRTRATR